MSESRCGGVRERLRRHYLRHVVTPSGRAVTVGARPKLDAFDPLDWPLVPAVVVGVAVAIRQVRFAVHEHGLWVVETYPRHRSDEAEVIAELPKRDAFDLVDATAATIAGYHTARD